jgi:hypothetical protein
MDYERNHAGPFTRTVKSVAQYYVGSGHCSSAWLAGTNYRHARPGAAWAALEQYVRNFDRDIGASTSWPEGDTSLLRLGRQISSLDQFNRLYFADPGLADQARLFRFATDAGFARAAFRPVEAAASLGNNGRHSRRFQLHRLGQRTSSRSMSAGETRRHPDNMSRLRQAARFAGDDIYLRWVSRLEHILGNLPDRPATATCVVGLASRGRPCRRPTTPRPTSSGTSISSTRPSHLSRGGDADRPGSTSAYGYSTSGSSNLYFSLGIPFGTP